MGIIRPSRLSFLMDEELVESLREMAYSQRRPKEELAADLLSEALMRRQDEENKLDHWRSLSPRARDRSPGVFRLHQPADRRPAGALPRDG